MQDTKDHKTTLVFNMNTDTERQTSAVIMHVRWLNVLAPLYVFTYNHKIMISIDLESTNKC